MEDDHSIRWSPVTDIQIAALIAIHQSRVSIRHRMGIRSAWLFRTGPTDGEEPVDKAKQFDIPKREVWEAFKCVTANQGAAGVDGQAITDFEVDLSNNLYKLWNRLSSGSYFPPPVRRVDIPRADGGTRSLAIPTVADRITQEIARRYLEPYLEPAFHSDSYGYKPGRSAIDAVRQARQRCWRRDSVLDIDVKCYSTASIGSCCSGQSVIIRTARGCCSTSEARQAAPIGIRALQADGTYIIGISRSGPEDSR